MNTTGINTSHPQENEPTRKEHHIITIFSRMFEHVGEIQNPTDCLTFCKAFYQGTQKLANIPASKMDHFKKATDEFVVKMLLGDDDFEKASKSDAEWKKISFHTRFGIQLLRTVGDGIVGPFTMLALAWKAGVHTAAIPMHLIAAGYVVLFDRQGRAELNQMMTLKQFQDFAKDFLEFSLQMLTSALVSALVYGSITTTPVSLPIITGTIAIGAVAAILLASHIAEAIEEEEETKSPGEPINWGSVAWKVGEKSFESLQGVVAACIVGIAGGSVGAFLFPLMPGIPSVLAPSSMPMAAGSSDVVATQKTETASEKESIASIKQEGYLEEDLEDKAIEEIVDLVMSNDELTNEKVAEFLNKHRPEEEANASKINEEVESNRSSSENSNAEEIASVANSEQNSASNVLRLLCKTESQPSVQGKKELDDLIENLAIQILAHDFLPTEDESLENSIQKLNTLATNLRQALKEEVITKLIDELENSDNNIAVNLAAALTTPVQENLVTATTFESETPIPISSNPNPILTRKTAVVGLAGVAMTIATGSVLPFLSVLFIEEFFPEFL